MSKIAFLFPGQGSQVVGMGKALYESFPEAKAVLDQFNEWVSPDLLEVMFEGPEETLKRTQYTQPAILAVSLAALAVLQQESGIQPQYAAGHSLGEYSALYAAGVLDLETVAKLVKKRAECMEKAPAGAMAAILGLPETMVEKAVMHISNQGLGVLTIANYNTAEQFIISGDPQAVEAACTYASQELWATKAMRLPVGGAFHSPLMAPVSENFKPTLEAATFHHANFPVITNVDAQQTTEAHDFKVKLIEQIASPVRWLDSMSLMRDTLGVNVFIEIGPGRVLSGMVKKLDKQAVVYNIADPASLEKTLAAFKEKVSL